VTFPDGTLLFLGGSGSGVEPGKPK